MFRFENDLNGFPIKRGTGSVWSGQREQSPDIQRQQSVSSSEIHFSRKHQCKYRAFQCLRALRPKIQRRRPYFSLSDLPVYSVSSFPKTVRQPANSPFSEAKTLFWLLWLYFSGTGQKFLNTPAAEICFFSSSVATFQLLSPSVGCS